MSPVEQAAAVYQSEPCARTFREDLELHLLNGYVFSTPEFFAMARPVSSIAKPSTIVNPEITFPAFCCDCWHVFLFAGDIAKALQLVPFTLPFISFERQNKLRLWPFRRIEQLILRHEISSNRTIGTVLQGRRSSERSCAPASSGNGESC